MLVTLHLLGKVGEPFRFSILGENFNKKKEQMSNERTKAAMASFKKMFAQIDMEDLQKYSANDPFTAWYGYLMHHPTALQATNNYMQERANSNNSI